MLLQQLIDMFEHQADSFIPQDYSGDSDIPSLEDYDQYDHVDNPDSDSGKGKAQARSVDKCWVHLAALWTLGTWTLRLDYGLID